MSVLTLSPREDAMSYLARKYRPQTFADVVGQGPVTRTLANAITRDKVHHAFLFTGTRGVGKTTMARILAKALNCANGPTPEPCNACPSCLEITAGTSVDVLEIDGASNRGIDDVRELRDSVRYLPSASRTRIVIIDEVHMLTKEAFNALLKTLEEPPPHVKFILATTDPHRLPETILSRVQRYDFREVTAQAARAHLARIARAEGVPFTDDHLTLIVHKARGSIRDALSLLDQAISYGGADLSVPELADLLGILDWRLLFRLSEAVLGRDARAVLARFDEVFAYAYDTRQLYIDLLEHFRNLVVARVLGAAGPLVDATSEEAADLARQAAPHDPEHVQLLFRMLVAAEDEILRSASPKLVLEMTLLAMATVSPATSLEAVLARITGLAGDGGEAPALASPVTVPLAAAPPAAVPPVAVPPGAVPPARSRDKIAPDNTVPESAPTRVPPRRIDPEAEAAARKEALDNPVLKQVLDLFDGRIEDIRVEDRKR
jgi:DNA polymerase-3 subunit gamma/tau